MIISQEVEICHRGVKEKVKKMKSSSVGVKWRQLIEISEWTWPAKNTIQLMS